MAGSKLFLICFILIVSACSVSQVSDNTDLQKIHEISTQGSPLSLVVNNISSDNNGTIMEAEVVAKTDWNISKVSLNFSLFKDGQLVESIIQNLKDFNFSENPDFLAKDQKVVVSIKSNSTEVTDYQLSLGWGQDAERPKKSELQVLSVNLVNLGADPECASYECNHFFAIEAILANTGNQPIRSSELELTLKDIKSTQSIIQQNVTLDPISIEVGQRQQIRLKINQSFPSGFGQQLQPFLKVVSCR